MSWVSHDWESVVLYYPWYLNWRPNLDLLKDDSLSLTSFNPPASLWEHFKTIDGGKHTRISLFLFVF